LIFSFKGENKPVFCAFRRHVYARKTVITTCYKQPHFYPRIFSLPVNTPYMKYSEPTVGAIEHKALVAA
jgi:hypothetical protein